MLDQLTIHMGKKAWSLIIPCHVHKYQSQWITDLKRKSKTMKFWKTGLRKCLVTLKYKDFLNRTQRVLKKKIMKLEYVKIKDALWIKDTINTRGENESWRGKRLIRSPYPTKSTYLWYVKKAYILIEKLKKHWTEPLANYTQFPAPVQVALVCSLCEN
jgi:hypothetical protein